MIVFEPVIETCDACGFEAWPVGATSADGYLILSGDLTPADVGTAMAAIAAYNHSSITPDGEEDDRPGSAVLIQRIIDAECLLAPGGLRVRDTESGVTVNPGCCSGLEDWQGWNRLVMRQSDAPWLGHDPSPWVEHLGQAIRIWPDGGMGPTTGTTPAGLSPIEVPAARLPSLVADARNQLQGFLNLLEPWAQPLGGDAATSLRSALATHFHMS